MHSFKVTWNYKIECGNPNKEFYSFEPNYLSAKQKASAVESDPNMRTESIQIHNTVDGTSEHYV